MSALHIIITGNSTPNQASSKLVAYLKYTILPPPSEDDLIILRDLFKEDLCIQLRSEEFVLVMGIWAVRVDSFFPFSLLIISFTKQNFLILMKFSSSICSVVDLCPKKSLPNPRLQKFSLRSFVVLSYTFWSMIHFEFNFVQVAGKGWGSLFCIWMPKWKDCPFSIGTPLHLC